MKLSRKILGIALLSAIPSIAMSAETVEATSFADAITDGKVSGVLRLRWENVDQDGFTKDADALTLRSLVGYETKPFHGFSVNTQVYGVSPLVDNYNDRKKNATSPADAQYPVVADPEDYDFHQLYIQWANSGNQIKLGRQNMFLDNWRYIGDVRFRQNWAVFNGISYVNTMLPNTKITLAHFGQLKTVTTKLQDIKTDIINVNYKLTPTTSLTGYGYLAEFEEAAAVSNSTKTFGLRLDGKHKLNDQWSALYTAEYAKQDDYKKAVNIDNDYYRIGAGAAYGDWFVRVDQEKLSGTDASSVKPFQTQFGTNHLFQGWADVFLSTPNAGIKDTMIIAGGKIMAATIKAEYHWINADNNFATPTGTGDQYGTELDLGVYYPFSKQLTGSVEYATFKEDDILAAGRKRDIQKFWVTGMYKF